MDQSQILDCNRPLIGRRIRLDRINPEHVDLLLSSYNNDSFWENYRLNQKRDISRSELLQHLQFEYERTPGQVGKIEWLIFRTSSCNASSPAPVGLASLSSFNSVNAMAEFMIGFFRDKYIKTGLGLETSLLVLDFAFNEQQLESLVSLVYTDNKKSQKSTLSLGFKNRGKIDKLNLEEGRPQTIRAYRNILTAEDFRENSRLAKLSFRLLGRSVTRHSDQIDKQLFNINARFTIS